MLPNCLKLRVISFIVLMFVAVMGLPPGNWEPNSAEELLFEGDVNILTLREPSVKKSSIDNGTKLWINGLVPFELDTSITHDGQQLILAALADLMQKTCLRFHQRTIEPDFVRFLDSNGGCSSYVGRMGGTQDIRLASYCIENMNFIQYLVMEALGLSHEHSQSASENHLETNRNKKTDETGVDWHLPTITSRTTPGRGLQASDQHDVTSVTDIEQIRRLYGCSRRSPKQWRSIEWNDENWGFKCDFPNSTDLQVVTTNCSRCGPLCWENEGCTHFTCKDGLLNGECKLKKGRVTKAAAVPSPDESVCGVTRAVLAEAHAIDWNGENWARQCDFPKSTDLKVVSTDCSRCGPLCSSDGNCTHFTCKLRQCILKTGHVTKADAIPTSYPSVCGITRETTALGVTEPPTSGATAESRDVQGTDTAFGLSIGFAVIIAFMTLLLVFLVKRRLRAYKPEIPMELESLRSKPNDCIVLSPLLLALEVPCRTIDVVEGRILGRGHFGEVLLAKIHGWQKNGIKDGTLVAIKRLKRITDDTKTSFLTEATLMADIGRHANIAYLLGVTTIGDTWMILEYCELGSLDVYLKTMKTTRNGLSKSRPERQVTATSPDTYQPVEFAYQIARGMVFLSHKQIVHRDLAARNILISAGFLMKISDFGLAVKTKGDYLDPNALRMKMPVKWMSPESLLGGVFNEKTDIWSYAVVLWEIYSLGNSPYNDLAATECLKDFVILLTTGYRMKAPDAMPTSMRDIMGSCWEAEPTNRPAFTDIKRELQDSCREDYYLPFDSSYEEYNSGLVQLVIEGH